MKSRLQRTALLLGNPAMKKLEKAHVLVVGCGAVGSYAIEALARSGIGKITLVDFDVVGESNINRQLFALTSTIGLKKIDVARARIADIDPKIEVVTKDILLNEETMFEVFDERPDFVIDAIDSLNPKVSLIAYLKENDIHFISSMGAALRTDPSKVQIVALKKTINCPLAFFIRKRLRKRNIDMGFPVVYSSELSNLDCIQEGERSDQKSGRVRNQLGSLPTITGMFGLMCANYAILYLAGRITFNSK